MANKAKKKDVIDPEDLILPDLNDTSRRFNCETCGLTFTDRKTQESHLLGKKHNKKVVEIKLKAKNKITYSNPIESEDEDSDDSDGMHCEICNKNFTGYSSYVAHVKGRDHVKKLRKQKLMKELDDMPEVIKRENEEKDSDNDDDDDDDDILPKAYAKCKACKKEFQGPESYKAHIKSTTHLKKIKQAKLIENLEKEKGEHASGDEKFSKCETCKKSFSGIVPYKIHMSSNVHKKNLEKEKIAAEIKEFCANTNFEKGYICKECNKNFTDPLAFQSHLQNNSHEKLKIKNAIAEFLDAYPEIVYVTPFDKEISGDESNEESDTMYYLICKLCQVSFPGPESAQDHVKSKKHITTKKEKKIQKELKERQKVSPKTTDGRRPSSKASTEKKLETKSDNKSSIDEFEVL